MITFLKSFYSKCFYADIAKNFKLSTILGFLVFLFVLKIFFFLPTLFFSSDKEDNFSLKQVIAALPATWELKKNSGLSLFDSKGNEIREFQNEFFKMDFNKVILTEAELKGIPVFITRKFIYFKKSYEVTHKQIDFDSILRGNDSFKLTLLTNGTTFFEKLKFFQNNKMIKELTNLKVLLFGFLFVGGTFFMFFGLLTFIAWKLLVALVLAVIIKIITGIGKKDILFSSLFLISIFIQSWYLLLSLLTVPWLPANLIVLGFGLFVAFKFVNVDELTQVHSA